MSTGVSKYCDTKVSTIKASEDADWPFSMEPHPAGNGTFRLAGTDVGVGSVLAVTAGGQMLFVRKASVPDYKFSDLWALPGGMVRFAGSTVVPGQYWETAFAQFLSIRVGQESGLIVPPSAIKRMPCIPPITSYEARGAQRWTQVIPFLASMEQTSPVAAGDHSIATAEWRSPDATVADCAPANCLIIARLALANLIGKDVETYRDPVLRAYDFCNNCAQEVGMPPLPPVWKLGFERPRGNVST